MCGRYEDIRIGFIEKLRPLYGDMEAEALFYYYFKYRFDMEKHAFFLLKNDLFPKANYSRLEEDLSKLEKAFPIQYLFGKVEFMGMEFKVDEHVLIPRPETEELIALILDEHGGRKMLDVLDVGTGSGIIGTILAEKLNAPNVTAIDISSPALEVARQNATANGASIDFKELDVLTASICDFDRKFDIIVSNPPYIPESEKQCLHDNVVKYEPGSALFVPDQDPLLFYKKIADLSRYLLKKGGALYFETHENGHSELEDILKEKGFTAIRKLNDLNGKPRFICALLN